jgi:hypothetical protein
MHVQGIAESTSADCYFSLPAGQLGHDIVGANAAEGVGNRHFLRGPGPAPVLECTKLPYYPEGTRGGTVNITGISG